MPDIDDLTEAFEHYARAPAIKEAVEKAIEEISAEPVDVPADLEEKVAAYLEEHPEAPWEEAVAAIVDEQE